MDAVAYRQFVELERDHFWFVGRRAIFFSVLDRELGHGGGRRTLDVGCGAGGMLEPLARYGHVRGIEPAEEMVGLCHERGFADVVPGDATALDEPDGVYDLVTLFDTIEHIADEGRALRECLRVLRPGGTLFVSVPAYQFLYANNDRVVDHQRRYTAGRLRAALAGAGFDIVQVSYFNALLFPVILPVVLVKKVIERFVDPGDTTNLSTSPPGLLNRLLTAIMSSERHLVTRRSLPFGHSLFAVARRRAGGSGSGSDADAAIVARAMPYSMTGEARLRALVGAVRKLVAADVPGGFAECGVWRGGSVVAILLTLLELGVDDRDVWLYDTFEGMTAPSEHDVSEHDPPALETWQQAETAGERAWPELFDPQVFNEQDVRETVLATGYPPERIHFVKGPVEETIPATLPGELALLRLDTDWYESTRHELEHLYPLLAPGGGLIIDDYGHWQGAARAVDEYFAAHPPAPELIEVDYTCRLAFKA